MDEEQNEAQSPVGVDSNVVIEELAKQVGDQAVTIAMLRAALAQQKRTG